MSVETTDSKAVSVQPDPFKQECWLNFLRGCQKSKATFTAYPVALRHYMKFLGITDPARLLEGDVATWEKNILLYLDKQVQEGLSSHTMNFRVNAIRKFYRKNRVKNIDWEDIREAIPDTKDRRDRPYRLDEIRKALQVASLREKASILLAASSGMRDGGLATLVKHDLTPIDKYGIYKIAVYQGWKEEYLTFCTPEARTAIDEYFAFRERCGEKITENSPLFRDDFDAEDPVRAARPKAISAAAIAHAVGRVMETAGVRKPVKLTEGQKAGGSGTYYYMIKKSSDGAASWSDSIPVTTASSGAELVMTLTQLDAEKMLFGYAKWASASIFYRVFNGTVWGSEQTATGTGLTTSNFKQMSSVSTGEHDDESPARAYIAYTNVTGTNGGLLKMAKFFGNGTFEGIETADSTLRHRLPNIMLNLNGDLNINSLASNLIYDTRRVNGTWQAPFNPYGTSFNSPDQLTSTNLFSDENSALWVDTGASPDNLVFDVLHHGTVAQSSVQLSPGLADYYEGERRVVGTKSGTLFTFYYDGSNILYKSSTDLGHTWSGTAISTGSGQIASDNFRWSLAYGEYSGGERIYILYYKVSGSNTNFYAKAFSVSGTSLSSVATVNLFSVANDSSCNPTGVCATASGSSDGSGKVYASFTYKTAGTWYLRVRVSSDGGATWSSSLGETEVQNTSNHVPITITRLNSSKMLLAWAKYESSWLFYRTFDGSAWSSGLSLSSIGWSANTIKQISSDTVNGTKEGYVVYLTGGNQGTMKAAKFFGNGTFKAVETADSTLNHWQSSISITYDDVVHIFSFANSIIYDTQYNGTTWLAPIIPYGTHYEDPEQLTAQIASPFSTGVLWREGDASPYDLIYAGAIATSPGSFSGLLSPSVNNGYEGEKRLVKLGETLFVFYYDGSNIYYQKSTDYGKKWGSKTLVGSGTGKLAGEISRWTIAPTKLSGSHTTYHINIFYYRKAPDAVKTDFMTWHGSLVSTQSDPTKIFWDSAPIEIFDRSNHASCDSGNGVCAAVVAAAGSDGKLYVAFRYKSITDSNYFFRIYTSSNGGSVWSSNYDLSINSGSTSRIVMGMTRLGGGDMLFVYATNAGDELRYRFRENGAWQGGSSFLTNGADMSMPLKQLSASSDSIQRGYVAFIGTSGSNSRALKLATWTSAGSAPSIVTLDSTKQFYLPSIVVSNNEFIHIFTIADGKVYDKRRDHLLVWKSLETPFGTSFSSPNYLTSAVGFGPDYGDLTGERMAVWKEGSAIKAGRFNERFDESVEFNKWFWSRDSNHMHKNELADCGTGVNADKCKIPYFVHSSVDNIQGNLNLGQIKNEASGAVADLRSITPYIDFVAKDLTSDWNNIIQGGPLPGGFIALVSYKVHCPPNTCSIAGDATTFPSNDKHLKEFTMQINTGTHTFATNETCDGQTPTIKDIGKTFIHEFHHTYSFSHSNNSDSIVYTDYVCANGAIPTEDDREIVIRKYPAGVS